MQIRELRPDERAAWLALRELLWPECPREQLALEQQGMLADQSRNHVLVAAPDRGELAGFAEVSIRDWAEGCSTRPVGYLEGWYVAPEHRRRRLGRQVSHRAHRALGYAEIGRAVLFAKRLAP